MKEIYFSFFVSLSLWFIAFCIKPFNFWFIMVLNGFALISLSLIFTRLKVIKEIKFSLRDAVLGIVSALFLYLIFYVGNMLSFFVPNKEQMLDLIYNRGTEMSKIQIGFFLFFPIGFAEEIFWRGFIQRELYLKYPKFKAFLITSAMYVFIHLPTLNFMLIMSALICGLYWGFLYYITDSLFLVMLSHMLWDPLIFVIAPVK